MRKIGLFILSILFVISGANAQSEKVKYVFFFIGDGMGFNHIAATEAYLSQIVDHQIGMKPLSGYNQHD